MGGHLQARSNDRDARTLETAALAAAIEQFVHDTTPPPHQLPPVAAAAPSAWQRAALDDGVSRAPATPDPRH